MIGNRNIVWEITVLAFVFLLISVNTAAASEITVEKLLKNDTLFTGDDATIILQFTNPYGKEIPIRIQDNNVFGNNGMDVQCLEYTIPADKKVAIAYSPVTMYKAGDFTLGKAKINYTDPVDGKAKTAVSNELLVKVKDSGKNTGQAKGITTLYRCDGMNMQSTSYSSSGGSSSFSFNMGGGQQMPQQDQNAHNNVQNNQMNQNMNSVQKEIQKQSQEQQKMKQEFQKNLAKNKEFMKEHQKMLEKGYNATTADINPESNDTGKFQVNYKNANGEKAQISGRMMNGSMEDMNSMTEEDRKEMMKKLEHDKNFQKFQKELKKQGFNRTQVSFDPSHNMTKIRAEYQDAKEDKKEITADYVNKTIQNVTKHETKENEEKENDYTFLWIILILIAAIIGVVIYKKYFRKKKLEEPVATKKKPKRKINWRREAKRLLDESEILFKDGEGKDAYGNVSEAVRLYLSYHAGAEKELTSTELIKILKSKNLEWKKTKRCLDICAMTEFARYKPNKKDFETIIRIGRDIIG